MLQNKYAQKTKPKSNQQELLTAVCILPGTTVVQNATHSSTAYWLSKSVDTKGNFGNFRSLEKHADDCG